MSKEQTPGSSPAVGNGRTLWTNRAIKIATLPLLFIVLVLVVFQVLMIPELLLGVLIMRFAGHEQFWTKALPILTLVLAGWAAVAMCRWIWKMWK